MDIIRIHMVLRVAYSIYSNTRLINHATAISRARTDKPAADEEKKYFDS